MVGLNRGSGGGQTPISGKWGQSPLIPLMNHFTEGSGPICKKLGSDPIS